MMKARVRPSRPIGVVLIDDHELVRQGLGLLVDGFDGVVTIAEAGSVAEVLPVLDRGGVDIVLMDLSMGAADGFSATRFLRMRHPGLPVVILSMHAMPAYLERARAAGCVGYIEKGYAAADLERAIRTVHAGGQYFGRGGRQPPGAPRTEATPPPTLSPRQTEVLRLFGDGLTVKEIAGELGISPKTVETHKAALQHRLGVSHISGLIKAAIRMGLTA